MADPLNVGDVVKLTQPQSDDESKARYILAELNGDRCIIQLICDMRIKPQELVRTTDIVGA